MNGGQMRFKNSDFDNKKISARYVNRFISLNSLEEFGRYGLFPNVKEVTESFGMYNAVTSYVCGTDANINVKNDDVRVFVVGDGVTPRTAGLFAFMTKWDCYSIDPQMRDKDYSEIKRLLVYRQKIEDSVYIPKHGKYHIILLPHSHADIQVSYDKLKNDRTWIITMPCCVHHELNIPCIEYKDPHVASPKNLIKVYSNYCTPEFQKHDKALW